MAEAPLLSGSFRTLLFLYFDSHPVTEQTHPPSAPTTTAPPDFAGCPTMTDQT